MRPWTPEQKTETGSTFTVKRRCNGCPRLLGDVTDQEIDDAIAGRPLSDVRSECWLCRGEVPTKALSLTRPWAWLIMQHGKDVENRSWGTRHRGPVLLHSAKSWEPMATLQAARIKCVDPAEYPMSPAAFPTGIVGIVDVVDSCTKALRHIPCDCGPWALPHQAHWRLANAIVFAEPIPCNGALGLWDASAFREQVLDYVSQPLVADN